MEYIEMSTAHLLAKFDKSNDENCNSRTNRNSALYSKTYRKNAR